MNYKFYQMKDYLSPEIEVVQVSIEGVLCSSDEKDGITVDDMDVVQGGAGSKWEWQ